MYSLDAERNWRDIETLTRELEKTAGEGEWLRVVELSAARHQAIEEHFSRHPVEPANADFYYRHLSQFLANEQRLRDLAVMARRQVMAEGASQRLQRKGVTAYQQAPQSTR